MNRKLKILELLCKGYYVSKHRKGPNMEPIRGVNTSGKSTAKGQRA